MKTLTSLFAAVLLMPALVAAAEFEGTVKMTMTAPRGQSMPITYNLKPGFARMEMQAGDQTMVSIMDQAKQEVMMLMPQQKMYMVHPIPKPEAAPGAETPAADVNIEKTGEHEKILGYDTTKWIVKTRDATSEMWVTDELGSFMGMGGPGGGAMGPGGRGQMRGAGRNAWEEALRGKGMFPLRVTTTMPGGESMKMEVTAIEKKSLPDSLFKAPEDYQKFDMGGMMRGMGTPPGMRPPRGQNNN